MTYGNSAFPAAIRCPAGCGATMATAGDRVEYDEATVDMLRSRGWQVVDGAWTCPADLPEERRARPGAMGRRPNTHCTNCGDDRGGAYGHEAYECTWTPGS